MGLINKLGIIGVLTAFGLGACVSPPVADVCTGQLPGNLDRAISEVESRLARGCDYHFDSYFASLLAIAAENPDKENPRRFSDHLMNAQADGIISRRQAEALYNRYFNVKFVSFAGDYNTCAQACPVRSKVLTDMRTELTDKELGLVKVSDDASRFYRADNLLQETDLVLEATCRACQAGQPAGEGLAISR